MYRILQLKRAKKVIAKYLLHTDFNVTPCGAMLLLTAQ